MMAIRGTKLRSWQRRLEAAQRKVAGVASEIEASKNPKLADRLLDANCDLGECLSILGATIEICRDPRGGNRQSPSPPPIPE